MPDGVLCAEPLAIISTAPPLRVLVVDDSAYVRYSLSKALSQVPGMAVAGVARDGQEALEAIPRLRPDVVTLDVEMPRMDGLTTLRAIMSHMPCPVIMLSSLTVEGARETVMALVWGAVDFVAKPQGRANILDVVQELAGKIQRAAGSRVHRLELTETTQAPSTPAADKSGRRLGASDKVVVIGASTGGPRALVQVMRGLPRDLPASVLIVQHMPVGFTRSLAERLNGVSPFEVREAALGDELLVGRALLAPGGFHMETDPQGRILLHQKAAIHGVRPSVDVTLSSVARHYQAAGVSVVLTGMGHDGTNGSALIHQAGGHVIAEAESTCVVWGMPRSVIEAGVADQVLALPEVAGGIQRAVRA
jgi:two-component system chemotaxis response regulator CheB